ncbi:MAG: flagellar FliJ family protein [Phycisphaeraceae bacterium]|nr:flagellar FliJ family protein [Phycisphaeraceae bacterium]
MRRRKPLDSLQRLAEFDADAASREIGQRLAVLHAEEERLQQIDGYVQHYERLSADGSGSLTTAMITGRRQFTARLREAATRQRQLVAEEETRYRQQVERWREARAQALALQRFNERLREQADEHRARQEQRRLDEIAQRRRP